MKNLSLRSKGIKALAASVIFGALFLSSFLTANAQTITFAQFIESVGSNDFVFTNNTISGTVSTVSGGSPIDFKYLNIAGLPSALTGFQSAHLSITTGTTTLPATNTGGTLTQPLNQTVTIRIIRDTPAPVGTGSGLRTNLLTAVFTPAGNTPGLVGSSGGNSATLSATTPDHVVTFTSDFLGFALTSQRNMGLSFSSVTPSLLMGGGNFLQSFNAAATGTFASNPVPIYLVPTAAAVGVSGRVISPNGSGLRNAHVVLIEADGTIHRTVTGGFGYYTFEGIEVGQTVTVSVNSKRYTFASQAVSLEDSIADLDFYGEY